MSWTDVFPVLTDECAEEFENEMAQDAGNGHAGLFEVAEVRNRRSHPAHVVATSLFWKRDMASETEITSISREAMINASELGFAGRYPPWESYVLPILQGGRMLARKAPRVVLRVYLANDLDFLVEDIVRAGCEVHLMKT
ncbi:MAG: hypothetical protein EOP84_24340, partial [Verrucomicrobiaceae bacterium]